jgi:NTP pyrophosphatase (non-canonical NTP hydrolase)
MNTTELPPPPKLPLPEFLPFEFSARDCEELSRTLLRFQKAVHGTAEKSGWWEDPRDMVWAVRQLPGSRERLMDYSKFAIATTNIAMAMGELGEALDALRTHNPPYSTCPNFSSAEIEVADCVLRLLSLSQELGWNLPEAMIEKAAYNRTRTYRHNHKIA